MKLICIRGNSNSFTKGKEYKVVKTLNDERYLVVDNNDIETNIPLKGLVWSFKIKEEGDIKMNKQDLENKIKDLENDIQASQNTIEELKKAIVNIEEKAWKPKKGEKYYCIDGIKIEDYYNDSPLDKEMINYGNYFKTEKQAERALFEQNLRLKLRKFAEDNNDKIDWKGRVEKYYIFFDYVNSKLTIDFCRCARNFSQIYFSSKKIAEKAIEQFKDELIKYFTEW